MDFKLVACVVALIAFNVPLLFAFSKAAFSPVTRANFAAALQEKDADGGSTGATSYSRITGAVGAAMVGSLFWIISNVVIAYAILDPEKISDILGSVGKLFLVGAALFLPYAFNQLKSVLQ